MTDAMKRFLEESSGNEELKTKLEKAHGKDRDASVEKAIVIAKEYGYELGLADFDVNHSELDDSELEAVAGGVCACVAAGGGEGTDSNDGNHYTCVCVLYGQGGDGRANDANCFCPGAGSGTDHAQCF